MVFRGLVPPWLQLQDFTFTALVLYSKLFTPKRVGRRRPRSVRLFVLDTDVLLGLFTFTTSFGWEKRDPVKRTRARLPRHERAPSFQDLTLHFRETEVPSIPLVAKASEFNATVPVVNPPVVAFLKLTLDPPTPSGASTGNIPVQAQELTKTLARSPTAIAVLRVENVPWAATLTVRTRMSALLAATPASVKDLPIKASLPIVTLVEYFSRP